jgi:pilus assembly protein CpaB
VSAEIIAVLASATSLLGTRPRTGRRSVADEGALLMDRRRVLLVVAADIAALGTLLVFLYVRGADTRAEEKYHAVKVLKAVKQINAGETVEAAQAAGKIAVSINLTDTARVAGFVNPGDQVAIFMNSSGGAGLGSFTRLLLSPVEVIAVGTTTVVSTTKTDSTGAQTTEQLPRTLFTLGVTQDEAQKIMFASGNGELAFAKIGKDVKLAPDPGANADNLFK